MVKNNSKGSKEEHPLIEGPSEGYELSLSADKQWLRLVVGGKQIASFHVNYVNKVLGVSSKTSATKSHPKKSELPASV